MKNIQLESDYLEIRNEPPSEFGPLRTVLINSNEDGDHIQSMVILNPAVLPLAAALLTEYHAQTPQYWAISIDGAFTEPFFQITHRDDVLKTIRDHSKGYEGGLARVDAQSRIAKNKPIYYCALDNRIVAFAVIAHPIIESSFPSLQTVTQ